ncbi:MAG: Periplasmic (Fe) hydrogenase large subunit [Syntrophorhabdaceae bacterium PtaU1.Bin034]|nr:MAG: Periplasmic (Fe) hydrogenase large subunit [Syntrophorhabdaceae bacterium PtaU1.Bin034]
MMSMGGGRGGRGSNRRAGRGMARGAGAAGLISDALGLVGDFLRTRKARQGAQASDMCNPDAQKVEPLPARGRVVPMREASFGTKTTTNGLLASVELERCSGCGICTQVCPTGAISVEQTAIVDADGCTGCGRCVAECPRDALVLKRA